MRRVHIIGAGGPAGVGMTRCLKGRYDVTGWDASEWARLMMECEPRDAMEHGDRPGTAMVALPDSVCHMSDFRPPHSHFDLCRDKAKTAEILGSLAPKTFWIRDTHGAGGSGAQMKSEYLPGDNYSQEFVFHRGITLATFQKKRISYSVKSKTQGVDNRGSSAVSICTFHENVYLRALEAVSILQIRTGEEPHGFYGIDFKMDEDGEPKVTEINAGRMLTASYAFFSGTGYNLPLVGMAAHFGDPLPELPEYPLGWGQIRQVGQEPKLFPPEITKSWT